MKTSTKVKLLGLVISTGVAAYYSRHQLLYKLQQTKERSTELKDNLTAVIEKTEDVSANLKRLMHDVDKYSPILDELADEISEFQFLIKPHLDKLEKEHS
ncbi:hypothetical protein [Liquorilactobacillus capillatus]|uniref:Uncharacterized protein n=1 Tax=Liquorilactobacillus capillatus DSM 19910 TaxID=1423731 RepID=A0A0R1M508_9LACO|nr:hypothetical protein [Liquorilactobacillus capillatus]KRL03183.1 hypothetical protein FC81_GL000185 [Liquorilactobacillus capillatus DSM 19910]